MLVRLAIVTRGAKLSRCWRFAVNGDPPSRVCPSCGAVAGDHRFCGNCGLHLAAQPELPTRAEWEARARTHGQTRGERRRPPHGDSTAGLEWLVYELRDRERAPVIAGACAAGLVLAMLLPWATVWIRPFNAWQAYDAADLLLLLLAAGGLALSITERGGRPNNALRLSVVAAASIGAVWAIAKVVSPSAQGFEEQYKVLVGSGLVIGLLCIAGLLFASVVLLHDDRSLATSVTSAWRQMNAQWQWALGVTGSVLVLGAIAGFDTRRAGDDAAYLPATEDSVIRLVRDEWESESGPDLSGSDWSVDQSSDLSDLPDSDLSGEATDTNPDHWFQVSYCATETGDLYGWNANPYTEDVYQEGVSAGGC